MTSASVDFRPNGTDASDGLDPADPRPSHDCVRETIEDPAQLAEVLRALANRHCAGWTDAGHRLTAMQWDPDSSAPLQITATDGPARAGMMISLVGYNCVYRFAARHLVADATAWRMTLPSSIERIRHRHHRRFRCDSHLSVRFQRPTPPQRVVERGVHDLSWSGLGLRAAGADDLRPGDVLDLDIRLDGEPAWRAKATVAHISATDDGYVCGVSLSDIRGRGGSWIEFVEGGLHQRTARGVDDVASVWELYAASGYFGLSGKGTRDFDGLDDAFSEVAHRIAAAPSVGCHIVAPSSQGYGCTMAHFRLYQKSWLSAQLAKQPRGQPGAPDHPILGEVYLHTFEHALRDDTAEWVIAWVHGDVGFSRRVHHDFLLPYLPSGDALLMPFRALQIPVASCSEPPEAWSITRADPTETRLVLDHVAASRPPAYLDAQDFTAAEIRLESTAAAWRAHGLDRAREIWVARHRGRLLAASVTEAGQTGVHLFGLLDTVRLFSLCPEGREAWPHLLSAAGGWYRARGKGHFVYFDEEPELPAVPLPAGSYDLGKAWLALLRTHHVPDFLEFVWQLSAPRKVDPAPAPSRRTP